MSNQSIIYVVVAVCGVFALAAYVGLILVPAWSAYSRTRERVGAAFLTLYVLLAAVLVGLAIGAGVVWIWPDLGL